MFTKALQDALLEGRADAAVHSYKDMPTEPVPGLTIAAVPARGDPREALVAGPVRALRDFKPGATIGTSSPRRGAQALRQRPDLNIVPLRGSVGSRVAAQQRGDIEGTIMAVAGLQRAGLAAAISAVLESPDFLPAPAQAALAVEAPADRPDVLALIEGIDDAASAHRHHRRADISARASRRLLVAGRGARHRQVAATSCWTPPSTRTAASCAPADAVLPRRRRRWGARRRLRRWLEA